MSQSYQPDYDLTQLPDPDGFSLANIRAAAAQRQQAQPGDIPALRHLPPEIQMILINSRNSLSNAGQEGYRQINAGLQNYISPNTRKQIDYRLNPPPR